MKAVFKYEKFAGLVLVVVFTVICGQTASFADLAEDTGLEGPVLSGTALNLFVAIYGSSASWTSLVADCYVKYPGNMSSVKAFTLKTLGIYTSLMFVAIALLALLGRNQFLAFL